MKYHIRRNNFLKKIFVLSALLLLLGYTNSESPKVNIYKSDKSIKHSLFKERDSIDRMSLSHQGVPEPKK